MTYCIGMLLDEGLVFLSDSRTNAGIDQVSTFRKMHVYEKADDRLIVLMTAGNLSISQAVLHILEQQANQEERHIWNASSMLDVAQLVGNAVKTVHQREGKSLEQFSIDFNISLIVGGRIGQERCRMFQIYAAGNFIEASSERPYFQIGESKYGKPIIDRVIHRATSLSAATKCALISMDSTIRANASVGMPLDLLVYEAASARIVQSVRIDEHHSGFRQLSTQWASQLALLLEEMDASIFPIQASVQSDFKDALKALRAGSRRDDSTQDMPSNIINGTAKG